MALTEEDCRAMIEACTRQGVALMIAYRLHFDEANLKAVDLVQAGKLGEARLFHSVFTQQVKPGDIRLRPPAQGGGPLYDIGIYCINAARMVFADEPVEVFAETASASDPRFAATPEIASAVLRFPGERVASFVCSFGAARVDNYQVVGTEGDLLVDPAYDYDRPLVHYLTINGRTRERRFERHDQFAPELVAFSECVLAGAEPEPSGWEGWADIRVIRALQHSADTGRPVQLGAFERDRRPTLDQAIRKPPLRAPGLVHVEAPSMG
jgi:glucose-fructose oxidoreductase